MPRSRRSLTTSCTHSRARSAWNRSPLGSRATSGRTTRLVAPGWRLRIASTSPRRWTGLTTRICSKAMTGKPARPAHRRRTWPSLDTVAGSGEHEDHARRGAELGFGGAFVGEAGRTVELHGVRVGGDLQAFGSAGPQHLGDAADQRHGDAAPPVIRIHE